MVSRKKILICTQLKFGRKINSNILTCILNKISRKAAKSQRIIKLTISVRNIIFHQMKSIPDIKLFQFESLRLSVFA